LALHCFCGTQKAGIKSRHSFHPICTDYTSLKPPLVPVSSSQAVVGAILGIGLAKGGRNINLTVLRNIGLGWIVTPITSALISYISLFFMQNVFMMTVY
jgi:hypothetical protein